MPNIVVTRAASSGSTGNQDITTTDFGGGTPDAAIVIMTIADTDGTNASDLSLTIGFTDGTNQFCCHTNSEDAQSTTDCTRLTNNSAVIDTMDAGVFSAIGTATASLITNGIRLNWADPTPGNNLITVILIGDVVNALVSSSTMSGQDTNIAVTAGFQPTDVFTLYGDEHADGGGSNRGQLAFGFFSAASDSQACVAVRNDNNDAVGAPRAETFQSYAGGQTPDMGLEVGSLSALGYSITPRLRAADRDCGSLAIELSAGDTSTVAVYQLPSSTGTASVTSVGFQPSSLILVSGENDVLDSEQQDRGAFSICVADGTNEFSNAVSSEDSATPTNCNSWSDNSFSTRNHEGSAFYTGTLVSFDSDGFSIDWNEVGSGNYSIYWAAGALTTAAPSTGSVTIDGIAPRAHSEKTAAANYESLAIDGHAPSISLVGAKTQAPQDGSVTIDGLAPSADVAELKRTASPDVQAITIDGILPSVAFSVTKTAEPDNEDLSISTFAPSIGSGKTASAVDGSLSIVGFAPLASISDTSGDCPRLWQRLGDSYRG